MVLARSSANVTEGVKSVGRHDVAIAQPLEWCMYIGMSAADTSALVGFGGLAHNELVEVEVGSDLIVEAIEL